MKFMPLAISPKPLKTWRTRQDSNLWPLPSESEEGVRFEPGGFSGDDLVH
jgi:hypothetical protein